ncbi:MAG TPA: DUF4337 domain-containing protein [Salinarimonas sp.]|jgi:hypothetical protein|nr:DUF4337 domain-containing protein [Salinarimonas sp.]
MKAHEASENLNEAHERGAKRVALLIAVLAALLAVIEVAGGNAEQDAQKFNIDASNLWSFYQAKTVRQTILRADADRLEIDLAAMPAERQEAARKLAAAWRADIARYESEPGPTGGEGRRELIVRAKSAEAQRDLALAKDDMFDYASAAMQLAIVLASASVVIGIVWLAYLGAGIGFIGVAFALLGFVAPTLLQF